MARLGEASLQLSRESEELYTMLRDHAGSYTIDQRINAAMCYVTSGNMKEVSRICDIPYPTLQQWKESQWWPYALRFCHKRKDKELEIKLSKVINDSVNAIHDRVMNGDVVVKRDGSSVRKPMAGKDLAIVLSIVHDKRQNLRGDAVALEGESLSQNQKLQALEEKFTQFSAQLKAKTIEGESEVLGRAQTEIIQDGVV